MLTFFNLKVFNIFHISLKYLTRFLSSNVAYEDSGNDF